MRVAISAVGCGFAVLLLTGCAANVATVTTWYTDPASASPAVRLTNWPAVALTVVDERTPPKRVIARMSESVATWQEHSSIVVSELRQMLAAALGGRVSGDGDTELHVVVREYRASFSFGRWTGRTLLEANLLQGKTSRSTWAAHGEVGRVNTFGVETALSVAREAFSAAVDDLLRQLSAGVGGSPRGPVGKPSPAPPVDVAGVVSRLGTIPRPGGDAEYRHPTTGDIRHCDNRTTSASLLFGVIGGVSAGTSYADCKTALEQMGYVRIRAGQGVQPVELRPAQSAAPLITPPPAPPTAPALITAPAVLAPASRGPQFGVVELHTGQRLEGRIKEITEATVSLEIEGQPISFPRNKVRGVYFDAAPAPSLAPSGQQRR